MQRKEDHAASPQAWHAPPASPFFLRPRLYARSRACPTEFGSFLDTVSRSDAKLSALPSFSASHRHSPYGRSASLLVYNILEGRRSALTHKNSELGQWVHSRSWVLRQSQANRTSRKRPMRP